MKRTLSLFLTLVMALGILTSVPVTVSAANSGTCGENLTWSLAGGTLTISGTGRMDDYNCYYYNGIPVSTAPWYSEKDKIKSVVISNGVTNVGQVAFSYCTSITSVVIPDSVTSIDRGAFEECTNLLSVTIPSSVTKLDFYAFYNCTKLTSITLHEDLIDIGRTTFLGSGYYNDKKNWDDGVLYIGKLLVDAKEDIPKTHKIKSGTKTIVNYAFESCTSLKSVKIPDSVTRIGAQAFWECTNLESIIIPSSVTYIGERAFEMCTSLASVTLPNSIKSIEHGTFEKCASLTSVTIPNSVTSIGEHAFSWCTGLINIKIPDSVTSIGEFAFTNCDKIKSITIPSGVSFIGEMAVGYYYYDGFVPYKDFTIRGHKSSAAETYAIENGFDFINIGDGHKHNAGAWITDKTSTVNSAGSKHKECTECGEVIETAKIDQLKCAKPTLKKISNTTSGVKITWNTVDGADSYAVYRKTGSKGKYSKIGTATKTGFTDKKAKSGKKYYYYVKAVNEAGSSSASSSKSIYYLADATLKTPKSTKSGVTLNWTQITGADGYMVYRKTGSGDYKKIATVKGVKKVKYTDKSAKKGKTYTYKIKAYKSKTYSAYSNAKKIKDKY